MKYYKPKFDYYLQKKLKRKYTTFFASKEGLLTECEINKLRSYYNFNIDNFEVVNIPKNRTYIFFGIRKISKEDERFFYNQEATTK